MKYGFAARSRSGITRIKELDVEIYFKASFDKTNRTSLSSFRGPGIEDGIAMLETIRDEFGLPITTDFHTPQQIAVTDTASILFRFPRSSAVRPTCFLKQERQARLSISKKHNFSMQKMKFAVDKVKSAGNQQV